MVVSLQGRRPLELAVDRAFSAILRDQQPDWGFLIESGALDTALRRARYHGISALLLEKTAQRQDLPQALTLLLKAEALEFAMWELRDAGWASRAIEGLHRAGVQSIAIKGTGLAFAIYSNSAIRFRSDTDLIVPLEARRTAQNALVTMGWTLLPGARGEVSSGQANYVVGAEGGHIIDLHWKFSDSPLLSRLIGYQQLLADSEPLPRLSPFARAPGLVDSMVIACVHLLYHEVVPFFVDNVPHSGDPRLIWLYDIRELASRFGTIDWATFLTRTKALGIGPPCAQILEHAREAVGAPIDQDVVPTLAGASLDTLAARFLRSGRIRRVWTELAALPDWADRARFLTEKLFPDPELMRARYSHSQRAPLPWLYLKRLTREAASLWRR